MEKLCYERRSYAHLRFYIRNNLGETEQRQSLRAAVGSLSNKNAYKKWSQGPKVSPSEQSKGKDQSHQEFIGGEKPVDLL